MSSGGRASAIEFIAISVDDKPAWVYIYLAVFTQFAVDEYCARATDMDPMRYYVREDGCGDFIT
jgi:hypothetical protein